MKFRSLAAMLAASIALPAGGAHATDLEVTHWWTSGGEAAAVAEFAKAFDASGNKWVDGAIAGGGNTARPIMISRITGGDPMGAFQFNHGRQAEELIEAGLLRDLTELADAQGWRDIVNPVSLLDSCTIDGKVYCVPVNIHSWQWIWLSHQAFADAGIAVPTNWDEFVAAAPKLREGGKIPLALGGQPWQASGAANVLMVALAGPEIYEQVYGDKNAEVAASADVTHVFEELDQTRQMAEGSNVQDWNQATNLVITGAAGGQIMGDWAQGEFQVAGQVAGQDYTCLPGLGAHEVIGTGGDAFYFPVVDDPEITKAQDELATVLISPETQVNFNLKKGSLPIRGDVDLAAANDCMRKGLQILQTGTIVRDTNQMLTQDSAEQINSLFVEFFNDRSITVADAQARFVDIIANAD